MTLSRREFLQRIAGVLSSGLLMGGCGGLRHLLTRPQADLIVRNAVLSTLDSGTQNATAFAVRDGRFLAVSADEGEIFSYRGENTTVIDAKRRRVIPGLNDSHLHIIRGGLNYNLELRWDGVRSLADALELLRIQVLKTPPPQWVRVVGGFNEYQFRERRLPTLAELNAIAPETPVFILHLYDRALLNRAALRAVAITRDTPDPPGSSIQRDGRGNPTGLLIANPNAYLLYKTLAQGPKLSKSDQRNSTRHFMREMNRLGITSVIDAGGGFQRFPEDYEVIQSLHADGEMSLRIAFNLFTQNPGGELQDFKRWSAQYRAHEGDPFLKLNGAGEMLVYSAADFEDFRVARPELSNRMETELEGVVEHLAGAGWPFRLHATYDETISRALDVFERVNERLPLNAQRWFFDHCETVSDRNLERIKKLGGGVAIQHRMAYQGEYFVERYGAAAAKRTPPIRKMLEMGIPVGAGTDGTRVASYNPWVTFSWMTTGRTVGGLSLYDRENLLTREEALRLLTVGSSYFSGEENEKGQIRVGMLADFALLSRDIMNVADELLPETHSLLTAVGGKVVHAAEEYFPLAPAPLPVSPDWSPQSQFPSPVSLTQIEPRCGACGCFVF